MLGHCRLAVINKKNNYHITYQFVALIQFIYPISQLHSKIPIRLDFKKIDKNSNPPD